MKAFLFLIVIGLTWWLVGEAKLVAPIYLPKLDDVVMAARAELAKGALATTLRSLSGYTLGILIAYSLHFITLATGSIRTLDAQFAASRAVPVIALMPLFILWFGFGEFGRVLIVTLTGTAFFLAPLHGAFKSLPREWSIQKRQLQLGAVRYYAVIVIPGTLTSLGGAFRLTWAVCFTIAIAADYMGSQIGIGKFIDSARVTFNIPGIFLALIVSAAIGLIGDVIILRVYEKMVHWRGRTTKA